MERKGALIPYVTPEFSVRGTTLLLIHALEEVGADVIEPKAAKEPSSSGAELPHNFWDALEGETYGQLIVLNWTGRRKGELLSIRDSLCCYFSPLNVFII